MGDVLIVEADAQMRELLRTAAVAAGRRARTVATWSAAMTAAASGGYDLIAGTQVGPNLCELAAALGVNVVRVTVRTQRPDVRALRPVFETDPLAAMRAMAELLDLPAPAAPPAGVALTAAPPRTA